MEPASPVVRGWESAERTYAENQPEYNNLPAIVCGDGQIVTRWRMGWKERLSVLLTGNVYLWVSTFGRPLQPVLLTTEVPQLAE